MARIGVTPTAAATVPPAREWRWVPVLAVVASIAIVVAGARLGAALVTKATGSPVMLGTAVEVRPSPGWDVVSTSDAAAELHRGPVILDVFASGPELGGPAALGVRFVRDALSPGVAQLAVASFDPTTLADGVAAVRFAYVGVSADGLPIEGVVVAATGAQASVVFDARGPSGALAAVAEDLRQMVDGARVD
jgi:hypothetical protein